MRKYLIFLILVSIFIAYPAACDRGSSRKFGDTYGVILGPPRIEAAVNVADYPPGFPGIDFINLPIEHLTFAMCGELLSPPPYSVPTLVPGQFFYIFGDNFGQNPDVYIDNADAKVAAYSGDYEFGTVLAVVPPDAPAGAGNIRVENSRTGIAEAQVEIARLGFLVLDNGTVLQRFSLADGTPYGALFQLPAPTRATGICMSRQSDFILMSDSARQSIFAVPIERVPLEAAGGIGFTLGGQCDPFDLHLPDLPGGDGITTGMKPSLIAQVGNGPYCITILGNAFALIEVSPLDEMAYSYRYDSLLYRFRYGLTVKSIPPSTCTALACTPDGDFAVISTSSPDGHLIISPDNDSFVPQVTDYGTAFVQPGPAVFAEDNASGVLTLVAAFGAQTPGGNEGRVIAVDFYAFLESGLPGADFRWAAVGPGAGPVVIANGGKTAFVACRDDGTLAALDVETLSILGSIPLPGGAGDFSLARDPDNPFLYLLNKTAGTLLRVDVSDPSSMSAYETQSSLTGATGLAAQRIPR